MNLSDYLTCDELSTESVIGVWHGERRLPQCLKHKCHSYFRPNKPRRVATKRPTFSVGFLARCDNAAKILRESKRRTLGMRWGNGIVWKVQYCFWKGEGFGIQSEKVRWEEGKNGGEKGRGSVGGVGQSGCNHLEGERQSAANQNSASKSSNVQLHYSHGDPPPSPSFSLFNQRISVCTIWNDLGFARLFRNTCCSTTFKLAGLKIG